MFLDTPEVCTFLFFFLVHMLSACGIIVYLSLLINLGAFKVQQRADQEFHLFFFLQDPYFMNILFLHIWVTDLLQEFVPHDIS